MSAQLMGHHAVIHCYTRTLALHNSTVHAWYCKTLCTCVAKGRDAMKPQRRKADSLQHDHQEKTLASHRIVSDATTPCSAALGLMRCSWGGFLGSGWRSSHMQSCHKPPCPFQRLACLRLAPVRRSRFPAAPVQSSRVQSPAAMHEVSLNGC